MTQASGLEKDKTDQLRYGLEIILGTLIKGALLFSLAYLFNVLPQVALALAAGGLFRLLSGGAHCTGYWRCLVLGVTVYLFIGLAAVNMANLITLQWYKAMAGILILVATACTVKWAPGEVPYRAMARREINTFKALSLLYLFLWAGLILFFVDKANYSLYLAALLALAMQTISFTPWGYGLVARADGLMAKLAGKGGETSAFIEEVALHPGNFDRLDHSRHRH
ncbi:accessory gene regulator B [Desulfoscipio geothermicus DSM 3669]|uniref:Accessory gene regulator B n=2 Tax=Desulfoscipio geothermicus TaxID=39060 RepID=A0A1I6DWJ1_9FIRM|nr:accessory gene regulator B [Desulfoscipio geothermicus DSM 3669]